MISDIDYYIVTIIVTDDDNLGSYNGIRTNQFDFILDVDGLNEEPVFSSTLDFSYELNVNEVLSLSFPSFTDSDVLDFHTKMLELSGQSSLPSFMTETSSGI